MNKITFLWLLSFRFAVCAYGQSIPMPPSQTIHGVVIDDASHHPIPYATLQLLGNRIYAIILFVWFTYAAVLYVNLRYLLPRYLLRKHYLTYLLLLSAALISALVLQVIQEYVVYASLSIYSRFALFRTQGGMLGIGLALDYISSFLLDMLCFVGGTITVLLKLWMVDNQRMMQSEEQHTQSEIKRLKEQVSPQLLFKVLNRSGQLAFTEGEKASTMLLKLSKLLRYQLYDCSRAKVLLSAETSFLTSSFFEEFVMKRRMRSYNQ